MQGFPLVDFYSLLGLFSTVFLVYLGLAQLFKDTDSNSSGQENSHMNHRGGVVQRDDAHAVVDDQAQMMSSSSSSTSSNTQISCSFCGDGRTITRCSRCKAARYCSGKCQIKHWRAGHRIECKPTDVDSVSGVSSEGIGTSHTDISSSDHHRDQDQMPSTSASPYVCLVCSDDKADISCARCKVARYCSGKCQIKHWRAGHRIECKPIDVDSVSGVSSEGIGTSHTDISSSDHHRDQDQMPSLSASPYVCLVCGDDKADLSCARCKVARYCSGKCQIKHWRAGHRIECKPTNVDSVSGVSSEGIGTSHTDISSSDHHRDQDQMPSLSASPYVCLVCGDDKADLSCARCKVARYCSGKCQIKHWRAGHRIECKPTDVDSVSGVSSKGIGTSHTDISSSDHHRDRDQMPSTCAISYICLVCGDYKADINCCARCKVARYCSGKCQIKHWRAGHRIECKPTDVDSVSGVTSKGIGTSHTDISRSDHHRDRDQMPSTCAISYLCLVCGDYKADINCCARCKVARYCSGKCQIKHWRAGHRIECKPTDIDSVSGVSSKGIGTSHTDISSSDHHRDRDQMPSTSASPYKCLFCGNGRPDMCCAKCKVARYCSQKCQIKHWRAGHKSECKEYKSSSYADSASAGSSDSRGSDHVDISNSDHHRGRDQMPSAPASRDFCFVCGDWSDIRCNRCKVVRYCSQACETTHWREGHKLECKENKSPANAYSASAASERRGPGHVGTSSSEYQQSKKDGKLANTVQSPKRTSSKELPILEECPICFSTIQTSEPSSPFLACEICKHKFHATCLLKWFSTSKKSHCPLCQSPFKSEGAAV